MIKTGALIITILAVSYGNFVLLGNDCSQLVCSYRNLATVGFIGALSILFYDRVQKVFHGLVPVILVLSFGALQFAFPSFFGVETWWLLTIFNGFTLGGVCFFIEQKIDESDNVRALPGSFYAIVLLLFSFSIFSRIEPVPFLNLSIEQIKFYLCLLGLAYIFGYVRKAPEEPPSYRYSLQ